MDEQDLSVEKFFSAHIIKLASFHICSCVYIYWIFCLKTEYTEDSYPPQLLPPGQLQNFIELPASMSPFKQTDQLSHPECPPAKCFHCSSTTVCGKTKAIFRHQRSGHLQGQGCHMTLGVRGSIQAESIFKRERTAPY